MFNSTVTKHQALQDNAGSITKYSTVPEAEHIVQYHEQKRAMCLGVVVTAVVIVAANITSVFTIMIHKERLLLQNGHLPQGAIVCIHNSSP